MQNSQGTLKGLKAVLKDTDMVLRASTPSRAGGIRNPMAKSGEMGICSCKVSYSGTCFAARLQQVILMIAFLSVALVSMGRQHPAEVGEDTQDPPAQME